MLEIPVEKQNLQTLRIMIAVERAEVKRLVGMSAVKLSFSDPELSHILRRSSRDQPYI